MRIFDSTLSQRFLYGSFLLLWIFMNIYLNSYELNFRQQTSFGIIYMWVFFFPALIFLIQIIFNSIFGWYISFFIYLVFLIYIGISVVQDVRIKDWKWEHYTLVDYFILISTLLVLAAIGYILYKIKPLKTLF